ncbi:hypothetical protein RHGRI_007291 [Rhododendron griersonianum]|uniref:Uncharacterized protein n=1 Tax=Rhododendron griersonianum TaxID=479676 RepID=A0AAV6KY60_9ERIC|nr:hypothetical protein RHGRI_007291 [Rhododendron griersonianum]
MFELLVQSLWRYGKLFCSGLPPGHGFCFVAPQGNRVLIGLEELPEKLTGGVLLPKAAVKFERYLMGEVSKNTISTSAAVKLI